MAAVLLHCSHNAHDYSQEHDTKNIVEYSCCQRGDTLGGIHLLLVRQDAGCYSYRCCCGHYAEEKAWCIPEMGFQDYHAGAGAEDEGEYYTGKTYYSAPQRIAEEQSQVGLEARVEQKHNGSDHGKAIELWSDCQGFGKYREKAMWKAGQRDCTQCIRPYYNTR